MRIRTDFSKYRPRQTEPTQLRPNHWIPRLFAAVTNEWSTRDELADRVGVSRTSAGPMLSQLVGRREIEWEVHAGRDVYRRKQATK